MYWIDESETAHGSSNQTAFYCDDPTDVQNLPTSSAEGVQQGNDTISYRKCGKGSSCLCISEGSLYILNSSDEWIKV